MILLIEKAKSRQFPAETMTDAEYTDDLALLTNTLVSLKSYEIYIIL